jgi:hypothetical protein
VEDRGLLLMLWTSLHVVSECVHSAITITLHNQFKSEIGTGGVGQRFMTQEVQKIVEKFEKDLEELTMKLIMKNRQSFAMLLSLKLIFP